MAIAGLKTTAEASRDGARVYAQTNDFAAATSAARRDVPSLFAVSTSAVAPHGISVRVSIPRLYGMPGLTVTKTTVMP